MKYFMKKISTAMKDARILGVDVVESVSMIMAGILYEIGLIRKIKIWRNEDVLWQGLSYRGNEWL